VLIVVGTKLSFVCGDSEDKSYADLNYITVLRFATRAPPPRNTMAAVGSNLLGGGSLSSQLSVGGALPVDSGVSRYTRQARYVPSVSHTSESDSTFSLKRNFPMTSTTNTSTTSGFLNPVVTSKPNNTVGGGATGAISGYSRHNF
jgi:hypothetical protein